MTDLPRLVTDLRQAGLLVDQVFESLGTVTGTIGAESIESLKCIPGVAHVERQHEDHRPAEDRDAT